MDNPNKLPKKQTIKYQIIEQTSKELKQKLGLHLVGLGGGSLVKPETIMIAFQYFKPINEDEARKLILFLIDTFLEKFNSNKKLRSFIEEDYKPINLEFQIYCYMHDRSYPITPYLASITFKDIKIKYYYYVEDNYKLFKKEDYEEAKEINLQKIENK
jgi:hypothetical protein